MKRSFAFFAFGGAGMLLGAIVFFLPAKNAVPNKEAVPVRTETTHAISFQPTETFSGFVGGTNHANVTAKIGGNVIAILKEPGETVRAGEILAIVDGAELSAQANATSDALKKARETFDATKRLADSQVNEARAALAKTKENRDAGDATDKDVRIAEESLNSAKKAHDLSLVQASGSVVLANGSDTVAQTIARNRIVAAPFSGIVTDKFVSVGSFVAPGTPLCAIASDSTPEITVSVSRSVAETSTKNTPVEITLEGSDAKNVGAVFSLPRAVHPETGEATARVRFAKQNDGARPLLGTYASVSFPSAPAREAILVPTSSIVRAYDTSFIFVVNNGIAKKTPVTLGQIKEDRTEIVSGLSEGDRVVVDGMRAIRNGSKVEEK